MPPKPLSEIQPPQTKAGERQNLIELLEITFWIY